MLHPVPRRAPRRILGHPGSTEDGTLVALVRAMKVPRAIAGLGEKTALRSAAVGASATLVDLAILASLVDAFGVGPRIASPIGLLAGIAIQFVGNKVFAFRDRSSGWGAQGLAFLGVEAGAFALNALGFDLVVATTGLPAVPVRVAISFAVYFLFCLPLWSRVFARPVPVQALAAAKMGGES